MKIFNLTEGSKIYTSNAYLLLGAWNTLHDMNTLIDVGSDPIIIEKVQKTYTGVGKKQVDQVILTHNHMDHSKSLDLIREHFAPKTYAFTPMHGVDELLREGQQILIADRYGEIFHAPHHSYDSIIIYFPQERILFAGDTPLSISNSSGTYGDEFLNLLEKLSRLRVDDIYFGHGPAAIGKGNSLIADSLKHVRESKKTHT